MNIHSICIRKKLLGGLSEKWGSPMTVEQFIRKYPDGKQREEVLKNVADIVFFDTSQNEIPYNEAISLYKKDELAILNGYMDSTIRKEED